MLFLKEVKGAHTNEYKGFSGKGRCQNDDDRTDSG
jgi:hypothetical protein